MGHSATATTTSTTSTSATRATVRDLLDHLRDDARRTDVMRRALLVYAVVLDAHERGDRLAVVGMDGAVVHEVVGIEGKGGSDG